MSNHNADKSNQWILTTLTPLHIGTTDNILDYEYVYDKNNQRVYVLDLDKVAEHQSVDPEEFVDNIQQRSFDIKWFLDEKRIELEEVKLYSARCDFTPQGQIRAFIKHLYQDCYVPGTTLKGAIRTALLWKMLRENPEALVMVGYSNYFADHLKDYRKYGSKPRTQLVTLAELLEKSKKEAKSYLSVLYELCGKNLEKAEAGNSDAFLDPETIKELTPFSKDERYVAKETIEKLFGSEPHLDLMRSLYVSDSELMRTGALHVIKVDVYKKNLLNPIFEELVEVIPKGESLNINLDIDSFLFSERAEEKLKFSKKKHYIDPDQDFFTICNNFSLWFLKQEEKFYRDGGFENTADWCAERAEETKELSNACFLPIGWGTGWRGKTVGKEIQAQLSYLFDTLCKQYEVKDPITRKLTQITKLPLGWIKLKRGKE